MIIKTRDFGEVEIAEEDIIEFVDPILGFEGLRHYTILYSPDEIEGFAWLQSTEDVEACFIVSMPEILQEKYSPAIPAEVLESLGKGETMLWLVTVVCENYLESTVNLKSPIVVNLSTRKASQVVLEQDYPIRRPLF